MSCVLTPRITPRKAVPLSVDEIFTHYLVGVRDAYDDMVDMLHLTEEAMLENLYVRHQSNRVYTYTGACGGKEEGWK